MPFDLSIIDSSTIGGKSVGGDRTLVGTMLMLSRKFLHSTGPPRDAAAVLAARLLTRPGLHAQLKEFVTWGVSQIEADSSSAGGAGAAGED